MKISHEIPNQLHPFDNLINDYPYVLAHMLRTHGKYYDFYKKKLKNSSFSILDNSAFELSKSIPQEELFNCVKEFQPSHFILPDTLNDKVKTIRDSSEFLNKYSSSLQSIPIGVLQGRNFNELFDCFDAYRKLGVNYIAIPFDCIKESDLHTIRYQFFLNLIKERLIFSSNIATKIHFLGLQNPSELLLYTKETKGYITSIDTSSPIINGWKGNLYTEYGLSTEKPKDKLAENLDIELSDQQIEDIIFNVKKFREYANR